MKIELICIEKTKKVEYKNLIEDYLRRINKKISLFGNAQQFINFGDSSDSNTGMIQYDHNNNQLRLHLPEWHLQNNLELFGSGLA